MQRQNNSEVARLMAQIIAEFEAAQSAMYGMATGVARHQYINARMERMGALKNELATRIGDSEAMTMTWEALEG